MAKPNTVVCLSLRNVGKPNDSEMHQDITIKTAAFKIAEWLLRVTVAKKLEIQIGRTPEDLGKEVTVRAAMAEDLDAMFDELEKNQGESK